MGAGDGSEAIGTVVEAEESQEGEDDGFFEVDSLAVGDD